MTLVIADPAPIISLKGESGMGYLQMLVTAASLALTYGGLVGADMLMNRMASEPGLEQPAPAAANAGEEEEL